MRRYYFHRLRDMEFESSCRKAAKKNKNKRRKAQKKLNVTQRPGVQSASTPSNEEEFASFLFLLDMDEDESADRNLSSIWTGNDEQEQAMSAAYVASLAKQDQDLLETEFLRHFHSHLAWKKFLSGPGMDLLKDRVFLLMAKEKEVEGVNVGAEPQAILSEHFLYEELRMQHHFLTTPQVTDTPNDTAFKVTMVPMICELIRNCNQSGAICVDVQGDDEECAALFQQPVSAPGSCLASVVRPLYRELQARQSQVGGESEGEGGGALSRRLCSLCTSDGAREGRDRGSCPAFFEGPPEWHHNLPFFMNRVKYSHPSPERLGFVKHALRTAQGLRVVQDRSKFEALAYKSAHLHAGASNSTGECEGSPPTSLRLPFSTHVMLHRACHAAVLLKPAASAASLDPSEVMDLTAFRRLVTVQLPRLLVVPCSRCATPCVGECVCGTNYCSAACQQAGECSGCTSVSQELKYLTPVAWGRAPLDN